MDEIWDVVKRIVCDVCGRELKDGEQVIVVKSAKVVKLEEGRYTVMSPYGDIAYNLICCECWNTKNLNEILPDSNTI